MISAHVFRPAAVLVLAVFMMASAPALAQNNDADFFRGKTITYIVAAAPGGGFDTYARLLAPYLEKYLPGARIVIRNMPGAGHIVGANSIYVARPDGLTIGTFVTGLIYTQLLDKEGVRFDLSRMSWIGSLSEEGRSLVVSSNSGIETVEDLLHSETPILLTTSGIGASNHIESRILIYALDLNARLIPNMQTAESEMSMIRGETTGVLGSVSSFAQFIRNGNGRFVLTVAGERSARPEAPDAMDYLVREDARPLLEWVQTMAGIARLTAGPPGIPPDRLEVLRRAYDAAANDPDLRAEAERLYLPISPTPGEEVETRVKALLDQPPEMVELLRRTGADD